MKAAAVELPGRWLNRRRAPRAAAAQLHQDEDPVVDAQQTDASKNEEAEKPLGHEEHGAVPPAGPLRPAGENIANGTSPYPLPLLVFTAITFLLYAVLYAIDLLVIYWTFIPGVYFDRVARSLATHTVRHFLGPEPPQGPEIFRLVQRALAFSWRLVVGTQFDVSGGLLRFVDRLLLLSFELDVAALSSAVLLVLCLRRYSRGRRPPPRTLWQRFVAFFSPWNLFFLFSMALVAMIPVEEMSVDDAGVFASLALSLFLIDIFGGNAFLTTYLPLSCHWQIALSVYRLRALDPYSHQAHLGTGLFQLVLLAKMIAHASRSTKDWY
ncbi:5b0ab74d-d203-493b-9370-d2a70c338973 [Thermothielavioides terrestris]|uniref:5b0ab74d-d203-493b-9370-d2a70c338973 n=1 Tax=Thermothielavioides terrestris TaxID=2587410 RepID=A0A446BXF4_9PEZI|nr:5b0ab74d-d203-493b-9370-d2a70c338973 [Thermothielavioides terrestris]